MSSNPQIKTVSDALKLAFQVQVKGDLQQAEKICQGILSQYPDNFDALHLLGVIAYQCRKDQISVDFITKALARKSDNLDALSNIAAAYINLKDYTAAEESCMKALEINSNNIGVLANLGNVYKQTNDFQQAKKYYKKVLLLSNSHVATLSNMASIANLEGEFGVAEDFANKAIIKDSKHDNARYNLALAVEKLGRVEEALNIYKSALEINPNHLGALNNMALIFLSIGRDDNASGLLARAFAINPNRVNTLINLAALNIKLKQTDKAFEHYEKALSITPEYEILESNIAQLHMECGDLEQSVNGFDKLFERQPPKMVETYISRIKLAFSLQDIESVSGFVNDGLKCVSVSLWQQIDLLVKGAMASWLVADIKQVKSYLSKVRKLYGQVKKVSEKQDDFGYFDAKSLNAYFLLLEKLVKFIQKNDGLYHSQDSKNAKNYVVGDSHCLAFNGLTKKTKESEQTSDQLCASKLVIGTKIWHLIQSEKNSIKSGFLSTLESIPEKSKVIFCFGEIDCRADEGIMIYHQKSGESIENIVGNMLDKYVKLVKTESSRRQFEPVIYGVPHSNASLSHLSSTERLKFEDLINVFNAKLKSLSVDADIPFLDIYSATSSLNEKNKAEIYLDNFHIKPSVVHQLLHEF